MMKLEAGCRVQDYILVERLGAGAFGEVWKVAHAHLPRTAAVKFATSDAAAQALFREGVSQFGLDHPGIVKVLDANLSAAPPFVVLEYVAGKSLRALLRERGRLEVPDAASIFRQLAEAIAYAHEKGIVHGDVKPENVMVAQGETGRLVAKLTDFQLGGFAAGARPFAPGEAGVRPSLETRGAIGTVHYLAPEQETGEPLDGRADLFALGVVLFEMLTGRLPQGRDLPSDLEPSISWWWDHLFARCYTGRERRYPGARELLDDLAAAERGPRWGDMPSQREAPKPHETRHEAAATTADLCRIRRQALARATACRVPRAGFSLAAAAVALLAVMIPFGVVASLSSAERLESLTWRSSPRVGAPRAFALFDDQASPKKIAGYYLRLSDLLDCASSQRAKNEAAAELTEVKRRAAARGYRLWERMRGGQKFVVVVHGEEVVGEFGLGDE